MQRVRPKTGGVMVKKKGITKKVTSDTESMFWFVKKVQLLCVAWIVITTFSPKPVGLLQKNGWIGCPRETVCAEEWRSTLFLAISRTSAYSVYPAMILVFVTKCHALRTALDKTFLSIWVPFHDLHALHVAMGKYVCVDLWRVFGAPGEGEGESG